MRIVVVCEYFYPDKSGGSPTDLAELTRCLKDAYDDVSIDVITSRNLYRSSGISDKLTPSEEWGGIHITRLSVPKSNRPSIFMRLLTGGVFSSVALFRLLQRRRYDLVLVVTNPPANAMAAWIYAKLRNVPYIYLVHDLYPDIAVALNRIEQESKIAKIFQAVQKRWLIGAGQIVVLGRCMKRHLTEAYGVSAERVTVIPSWADPAAIVASAKENCFRTANRLRGFVILYAGNFSDYVNFDQILGAASILGDNPDILFVLVGDGVRKTAITERIAAEGLRNVRVLEMVPRAKMSEVLAATDLALISLDPRMLGLGVPSKLYPILASGRPIIAVVPPECEVAQVLAEEHCGVNVANNDASALAKGILRLYGDRDLLASMGANARRALENRFTLRQTGARFHELFSRVLSAR